MRQAQRRRARNRHVKSRMRTLVKQFRKAVEAGDLENARERLRSAEGSIRRAASKGVIPKRRASRSVGRLSRTLAQKS